MKNIYISIILIFAASVNLIAQDKANSVSDAVFNKISKEYTLKVDGSMDFRCIKQVQLLTYNAIHRLYGETFIVYNPEYQKLVINECYTVMANGKKVICPPNAFNEVLPRFAANAPAFNNLREMVVTHTGLEKGSTIYLDYTISTKKKFYPALMGQEVLSETNPVTSYDIKISVPDGTPLNFRMYNRKAEPLMGRDGYMRSFSWHLDNLPAVIPESLQPDDTKFIPSLVFTTAKDMNEMLGWLCGQAAFGCVFNDTMRDWASGVQKSCKDELTTVLTLQDKVVHELRLYAVPLQYSGYRVRTPEEVWKSAGGTGLEKALLFCSLLKSCSIQSEPVGIFTGYYDPGLGNLAGMNHTDVLVTLQDKSTLLLSVAEVNDQDIQLRKTLTYLPLKPSVNAEPFPASLMVNQVSLSGKLELEKDHSMTGKLSFLRQGLGNPYLLLSRFPNKAGEGISGLSAGDISESKIMSLNKEHSEVSVKVDKKQAGIEEGTYYFFKWPAGEDGIGAWHPGEMVEDRFNPLELPFPLNEVYSYEMEIPSAWQLANPIQAVEMGNSAGQMKVDCHQDKNKVYWSAELRLYESPVAQAGSEYYRNVKELLSRWSTIQSQGSIFRESK